MKKTILIAFAIFMVAIQGNFAQKHERKHDCEAKCEVKDCMCPKHEMTKQLNLTDDQKQKFEEFHFALKEKAIDLHAQIEKKELEIEKMMKSKNVDGKKLLELTGDISNLRSEIHQSRIENWVKIYNILNDEQKTMWVNDFGKMRDIRHGCADAPRFENFMKHKRCDKLD